MNKFIFIWIPKNAGTTISYCLQDLHMCRGNDSDTKKIVESVFKNDLEYFHHIF